MPVNLLLEDLNVTPFTITLEEIIGVDLPKILEKVRTDSEKKILIARVSSLNESTKGRFNSWSLEQKSRFLACNKFLYFSGTRGMWTPRAPILDWKNIYKKIVNILEENTFQTSLAKNLNNNRKLLNRQINNFKLKINNDGFLENEKGETFKWDKNKRKLILVNKNNNIKKENKVNIETPLREVEIDQDSSRLEQSRRF